MKPIPIGNPLAQAVGKDMLRCASVMKAEPHLVNPCVIQSCAGVFVSWAARRNPLTPRNLTLVNTENSSQQSKHHQLINLATDETLFSARTGMSEPFLTLV